MLEKSLSQENSYWESAIFSVLIKYTEQAILLVNKLTLDFSPDNQYLPVDIPDINHPRGAKKKKSEIPSLMLKRHDKISST